MATPPTAMERPTGSSHAAMGVGGLLIAGGLAGFAKSRSVPSLVAGGGLGLVMLGSAKLINSGECFQGHALAAGTSGLLAASMGARVAKGLKSQAASIKLPIFLCALGSLSFAYQVGHRCDHSAALQLRTFLAHPPSCSCPLEDEKVIRMGIDCGSRAVGNFGHLSAMSILICGTL